MNRILVSLLMIGVVLGIAGAGTWAYFSDTGTVTGNTFTAGTLELKIKDLDDPDEASTSKLPFSIEDVKPGDSGEEKAKLKNKGSITGDVWIKISNIVNGENGLKAPEVAAGDTGIPGELGDNMKVIITGPSGVVIYDGLVSNLPAEYIQDGKLNAGETGYLNIAWSVPTSVGNIIQSDKLTFDINVALVQEGGPAP